MPHNRRMAVLAALLIAVAAAGCAGTGATPTPTTTIPGTPPGGLITSQRFGYSIEVPPGWRYRPATTDWPSNTYPTAGATFTDNFEPATFPALDISTQQLPADQTPTEFLAELDAGNVSHGYAVEDETDITVDGVTGRLQRQSLGGENIWEIVLFDDGRVYAIYWVGLESGRETDEPLFRQIMSTFNFP